MKTLTLNVVRFPWRPLGTLLLAGGAGWVTWAACAASDRLVARASSAERQAAAAELRATKLCGELTWGAVDRALLEASLAQERRAHQERGAIVQLYENQGVSFGYRPLSGPPVPLIKGEVAATKFDVEPGLVLLDVGREEGVEKGYRFSIYRGTSFLGKVLVERVLQDCAGCRVLFLVEGASLRAGDSAATRLQ